MKQPSEMASASESTAASPDPSKQADIIIHVECEKFNLHKEVLVKNSDYFAAMFSIPMLELDKDFIEVNELRANDFKILVDGFYSGELLLTSDNIFSVTEAASMLQVCTPLLNQCYHYLQTQIDDERCFQILFFAEYFNLETIYSAAKRYCLTNFLALRKKSSFTSLSKSELATYLCEDYLVYDEKRQVLEAIQSWFAANQQCSKEDLKKIISSSVTRKEGCAPDDLDLLVSAVMKEMSPFTDRVLNLLDDRPHHREPMIFWGLLNETNADGCVDVIKLNQETQRGEKFDSMTPVIQSPGNDLGSAFCTIGSCVFLTGGGPDFGKMNWIRPVWQFDVLASSHRWTKVGEMSVGWRHHAMVAIDRCLYLFGGFGRYRMWNKKMLKFNLDTGAWSEETTIPTSMIKPFASSHYHRIYYLRDFWTIHSYSILTQQWDVIPVVKYPPHTLRSPCKLENYACEHRHICESAAVVAMVMGKTEANENIDAALLSPDSPSKLIFVFKPSAEDLPHLLPINSEKNWKHEYQYLNSAQAGSQAFVFLLKSREDDDGTEASRYDDQVMNHDDEVALPTICIKSFDAETCLTHDLMEVTNIRRMLSVVSVPTMPELFRLGQSARYR